MYLLKNDLSSTKPLNILLVEDDDGDVKIVKRAFKKAKLTNTLVRAEDGVDALEILRGENGKEKMPHPCMLLVDINMPRMNGLQFVQEIRKDPDLKKLIVFILTTSKRDEDIASAYDLNVTGYVVKETAGFDLLRLVGMIDHYWRLVEVAA